MKKIISITSILLVFLVSYSIFSSYNENVIRQPIEKFKKLMNNNQFLDGEVEKFTTDQNFKREIESYLQSNNVVNFNYTISSVKLGEYDYITKTRIKIKYKKKNGIVNRETKYSTTFNIDRKTRLIKHTTLFKDMNKVNITSQILFIFAMISLPFFGHAIINRKYKWAVIVLAFNIVGALLYYFKIIKKKSKELKG